MSFAHHIDIVFTRSLCQSRLLVAVTSPKLVLYPDNRLVADLWSLHHFFAFNDKLGSIYKPLLD